MSSAAAGPSGASSLMSAPEMNAFSPCPVTTSAPCSGSATNARVASAISPSVSRLIAFRTCGRFTNSSVTCSRRSRRRFLYVGSVDVLMGRTSTGVAVVNGERATIGPGSRPGNRWTSVEAIVDELLLRAREAALVGLARFGELAHPAGRRLLAAPHGRAVRELAFLVERLPFLH